MTMQSGAQIPPDFSIGFGTEVEERGVNVVVLVVFALVLAVVLYLAQRKRKAKKRA
jgi:hypothetical protein